MKRTSTAPFNLCECRRRAMRGCIIAAEQKSDFRAAAHSRLMRKLHNSLASRETVRGISELERCEPPSHSAASAN